MRSPERRSDDRETQDARGRLSSRTATTALLAAIMTVILAVMAFVVEVETRSDDGERREMRVIDVWWEALRTIPAEVPGVFNEAVLSILLVAALAGVAYIIVATLRLP